jgi:WbqC-like protein family
MRIAVMQPYLFPYIGYFQLMGVVDKFVLFDDVNYINKGWINRNRILVNNAAYQFTIPLIGASQNKKINETEIESGAKWRLKLMRTIEMSYSKAPHFNSAYPLVREVLNNPDTNLSNFIYFSIRLLADYMCMATAINPSSSIYANQELKGEDRILDICRQEGATEYVNPIGGMELYSKEKFEQNGVKLFFLQSKPVTYVQNGKDFVPWLSIIDALMFCSREEIQNLLQLNELI